MGKRVLLLRQVAVGHIFQPRGRAAALVVRVAGPNIPEDANMVSFAYLPHAAAVGIVLESEAWTDLVLAGNAQNTVNGIPILSNESIAGHVPMTVMPDPAKTFPACAIPGYDTGDSGQEYRQFECRDFLDLQRFIALVGVTEGAAMHSAYHEGEPPNGKWVVLYCSPEPITMALSSFT